MDFEARLREAQLKALQDFKTGRGEAPLFFKAGYAQDAESGKPFTFVASEDSQDRLGDSISAAGWDLANFEKNPVFLWVHDYTRPPLGTVPRVWQDGKQLLNTVAWDEADPFAMEIRGKYERKVLRAESVGFRALEYEEQSNGGIRFTRQELLEISAVPIPAHAGALTKILLGQSPVVFVMPEWKSISPAKPEEGEPVIEERPLPQEHSCRLRPPGDFQPDSFRRTKREHEGKAYSIIMGRLKGETTMTEQAYRYDKDVWEAAQAKSHCSSHDGSFEAAAGEAAMPVKVDKADHGDMAETMGQAMEAMRTAMALIQGMMDGMKEEPSEEETVTEAKGILEALAGFNRGLKGG